MDVLLVVNAGSSSLKFQVFELKSDRQIDRLLKGHVDGIGSRPRMRVTGAGRETLLDRAFEPSALPDLPSAMDEVGGWLRHTMKVNLVAVGHRVVHGGPDFSAPVVASESVLRRLDAYVPLAPLHQPHNLAVVRAITARRPDVVQVLCFDTAFHRNHGPLADHFALPEALYDEGVRRYGFHGLSYEYVAGRLRDVAPDLAGGRVIVAHLGSGASLCALSDGRSIESTMGFSALDGLPMGTRPGQLDPGVVLYLIGQKKMSVNEAQNLFYKESGLKGLSGISNDVRELESSRDPRAAFALEYFVYRIGMHVGMLAAALGGLDAFVFTAGIGENSPSMRARIAEKLKWLGGALDAAANESRTTVISTAQSRLKLLVVPTDEELIIARHALALLPA